MLRESHEAPGKLWRLPVVQPADRRTLAVGTGLAEDALLVQCHFALTALAGICILESSSHLRESAEGLSLR